MYINTIKGELNIEELGITYCHEHLRLDLSYIKGDDDTNYNDTEAVIDEMKHLKELGVSSVVELTNIGMGRDINVMNKVADESGLNVVLSTGFYKDPFLPKIFEEKSSEELVQILVNDLTVGIDGTDIKAQIIGEIGTSLNKMTPLEAKLFDIVAKAHVITGATISTHTTLGTFALEQLAFLKDRNVDLSKVIVGHLDLNCNRDYHKQIAETGATLEFDTIGKINYAPDEDRVDHIDYLIKSGFENQIVLSQDLTRKSHLKKNGGIGYSYLMEKFIPKLRLKGITEDMIRKLLIDNPKRILQRKE